MPCDQVPTTPAEDLNFENKHVDGDGGSGFFPPFFTLVYLLICRKLAPVGLPPVPSAELQVVTAICRP
jgi:hypothetical protein